MTLLAHGCPPQATLRVLRAAAFGWDERTVACYQQAAGAQCQRVHEPVVQAGRVELGQVQADELRVRACGPTQRLLRCVDGLVSYVAQARRVFCKAVRTGRPGRPCLVLPAGVLIAQRRAI